VGAGLVHNNNRIVVVFEDRRGAQNTLLGPEPTPCGLAVGLGGGSSLILVGGVVFVYWRVVAEI